jgi:hypothetical protein
MHLSLNDGTQQLPQYATVQLPQFNLQHQFFRLLLLLSPLLFLLVAHSFLLVCCQELNWRAVPLNWQNWTLQWANQPTQWCFQRTQRWAHLCYDLRLSHRLICPRNCRVTLLSLPGWDRSPLRRR